MNEIMKCPLCSTTLKAGADPYYFSCSGCGAWVKDKAFYITPEEEKRRYEEHENDVNDERYQHFTSPITNTILEHYAAHHSGLDYGCGTGPVIAKMLDDRGYHVVRYDPYFYPDESYLNFRFDYIFSCEVFEHFHHPAREIQKLVDLLKPGGRLIIMTHIYNPEIPFGQWYYRKDETHVFIYTRQTMHYIAQRFHLNVEVLNERLIVFRKES